MIVSSVNQLMSISLWM